MNVLSLYWKNSRKNRQKINKIMEKERKITAPEGCGMLKDTKDSYEGMLESAISWFEDIAEMCSKLTSGNVSHQGASIRGKAIRAAEYIKKRMKG